MKQLPESFERRMMPEPNTGCWIWTGPRTHGGYGTCYDPISKKDGKTVHRVVYQILVGAIPAGMTIDHICRCKCCINPNHMEIVTLRENLFRASGDKGVSYLPNHCVRKHKFTTENTFYSKIPGGFKKRCRECTRLIARRSYHKKRKITLYNISIGKEQPPPKRTGEAISIGRQKGIIRRKLLGIPLRIVKKPKLLDDTK